ncbi:MAG: hypothetical protein EB119_06370 [Synechococcaceae bacterium WBB_34_004]|nr:hypothetical protein [Synechococcaceae bacterium WBB_34_004]
MPYLMQQPPKWRRIASNPTTPTQDLPVLLPFLCSNLQQPQQQVPVIWIPVVLMPFALTRLHRH